MKRKALGILLFCLVLLGAIVAGYWDMLNTERLRIAQDAAMRTAAQHSGSSQGEQAGEPSIALARREAAEPAAGAAMSSPGVQPESGEPPSQTQDAQEPAVADREQQEAPAVALDPEAADDSRASAPAPDVAAGNPHGAPPTFDILRVEPDGSTVIAGRAAPEARIDLLNSEEVIGSDQANAWGDFVILLEKPLAPGIHQMRLRATTKADASVVSDELAIVSVPPGGEGDELLALVESPDAPTRLIDVPAGSEQDAALQTSSEADPDVEELAAAPGHLPDNSVDVQLPIAPADAGAESEAAPDEEPVALPRDIAAFVAKSRRFATNLRAAVEEGEEGETDAATPQYLSLDARTLAEEGRVLLDTLALPAGSPSESNAATVDALGLHEIVRRSAQAADELASSAEAGTVDVAKAADAAADIEALADAAESRMIALSDSSTSGEQASTLLPDGSEDMEIAAREGMEASTVPLTPSLPTQENDDPANASSLSVEAVEIERGTIFVAGTAEPGSLVRIYIDNEFLAEDRVAVGDRFLVAQRAEVPTGLHLVRADQIGPGGEVARRAEVPFFRPEGTRMSAIAPPAGAGGSDTTAHSDAVEMLPSNVEDDGTEAAQSGGVPSKAENEAEAATAPKEAPSTGPAAVADTPVPPAEADAETSQSAGGIATLDGNDGDIAVTRQPALEAAESRVIIRKGDTLWEISRDTYGSGTRYTVIYLANGDQIRNPDRIYPGQVFRLPEKERDSSARRTELN